MHSKCKRVKLVMCVCVCVCAVSAHEAVEVVYLSNIWLFTTPPPHTQQHTYTRTATNATCASGSASRHCSTATAK